MIAAAADQRALAWLRKTRAVSMTPLEDGGGWSVMIEPLPGHGDLVAFATPARLAPAGVLAGQLLGGRVALTMRARADDEAPTGDAPGAQTVDDLPLVRRMKEVFADYDVRLIGQWPATRDADEGGPADQRDGVDDEA